MKNIIIKLAAIYTIIRHPVWTIVSLNKNQLTEFVKCGICDAQVVYKGKSYVSKVLIRNVSEATCTDEDLILSKAQYYAEYESEGKTARAIRPAKNI